MTSLDASTIPSEVQPGPKLSFRPAWPELALLTLAAIVQSRQILNPDLGWLLTVCDKMLGGAKLGRDVLEINPPLNVLVYMPAAWLGSLLHLPAHLVLIPMILLLAFWVSHLTVELLRPLAASADEQQRLRLFLLFMLIVFPGETFGQREHLAIITCLPFVALTAVGALGHVTSRNLRIIAGIGAGFAMCMRPHYALVVGLPMVWNAAKSRSLRPLFPMEMRSASAIVFAYLAIILLAFPEYTLETTRTVSLAYLPIRMPWDDLFWFRMAEYSAGLIFVTLATRGWSKSGLAGAMPWLLSSIGGLIGYLLQGKGFTYSHLPLCIFALASGLTAPALLSCTLSPLRHALAIVAAVPLFMLLVPLPNAYDDLDVPIREFAPPHPKLLQISHYVGIGEPLVRRLDGTWASAAGSQLIGGGAMLLLRQQKGLTSENRAELEKIALTERDRLREDLINNKPDVLMIDHLLFGRPFEWLDWARGDPVIAREIELHYVERAKRHKVSLWFRKETMKQPVPATK